ncbi:MAG: hypothetical protein QF408_15655 [Pirellulales bacterium]|nr:hypothetical protein [Pirellulales bacterium]
MSDMTLGHRLARELTRRGNRRAFFRTAQYRELRCIDSVDELAEFLDRTGYRLARSSENIEDVAGDIVTERNAPGLADPAKVCWIDPLISVLLLPIIIVYRLLFGKPSDRG